MNLKHLSLHEQIVFLQPFCYRWPNIVFIPFLGIIFGNVPTWIIRQYLVFFVLLVYLSYLLSLHTCGNDFQNDY